MFEVSFGWGVERGLTAGALTLAAVNLGIHVLNHLALFPALRSGVDERGVIQFWQALDRVMARRMPPLMLTLLACCLTLVFLLALRPDPWACATATVAALSVIADIGFTLNALKPINHRIQQWDAAAPPRSWAAEFERLQSRFKFRMLPVSLSFCALLTLAMGSRPSLFHFQ